jgi:hypothetical protein
MIILADEGVTFAFLTWQHTLKYEREAKHSLSPIISRAGVSTAITNRHFKSSKLASLH